MLAGEEFGRFVGADAQDELLVREGDEESGVEHAGGEFIGADDVLVWAEGAVAEGGELSGRDGLLEVCGGAVDGEEFHRVLFLLLELFLNKDFKNFGR